MSQRKIKTALISVFDKTGLQPLIETLVEHGVSLYSTGGTETFIRELGHEVNAVEELTGYPSILGGRVKTLHPKVFGGILNRGHNENDQEELEQYEIPGMDLVIVDLYPFEKTVAGNASESEIIEKEKELQKIYSKLSNLSEGKAEDEGYIEATLSMPFGKYKKDDKILVDAGAFASGGKNDAIAFMSIDGKEKGTIQKKAVEVSL